MRRVMVRCMWVALALTGCGGAFEGDSPGECADGADNDGDGEFDCDDSDCRGAEDCAAETGAPGPIGGVPGGSPGPGTGTGTGQFTDCFATVLPFPEPNATGVYYRTSVEALLDNAILIGTETITVSDGAGAVAGTTTLEDDNLFVFEAASPLQPSTTYSATLEWACGPSSWQFTTSSTGAAVDANALAGRSYRVDLGSGRWVEPLGFGALASGLIEEELVYEVQSADASSLVWLSAGTSGVGQDLCAETVEYAPALFGQNPYFEVAEPVLALPGDIPLTLTGYTLSGAFSPAADALDGVELGGVMDVDPLADLVGSDPCALLVTFGVQCQPCPDGSDSCLDVRVDSIRATEDPGLDLVPRSATDIACDGACGTPPATGCP